jgi:FtsZ-binding cell division protein ZapB
MVKLAFQSDKYLMDLFSDKLPYYIIYCNLKESVMGRNIFFSILLLLPALLHSCVSSKKYKEAHEEVQRLNTQNNMFQLQIGELNDYNKTISAQFSNYRAECEDYKRKSNFLQANMYLWYSVQRNN